MSERLSRRDFIFFGGVTAIKFGLGVLPACSASPSSEKGGLPGSSYNDVKLYYPELNDKIVQEAGDIATTYSSMNYFNFAPADLDSGKLKSAIAFFEDLGTHREYITYHVGDAVYNVPVTLHAQGNTKRSLFIISEGTPYPEWFSPTSDQLGNPFVSTTFENGDRVGIIRIVKPRPAQSPQIVANLSLYRILCDWSLDMQIELKRGICATYGYALNAKGRGLDSTFYQLNAITDKMGFDEKIMGTLPRGIYDGLPNISEPLTVR